MARLNRRRRRTLRELVAPVGVAALLSAAAARPATSQNQVFERLNLDKLQLVSLGATWGRVFPSQVEPAALVGVSADYGEIAPAWHVVFGVSYWESRFRDGVVQAFVDTLDKSVVDTTGRARVAPSRISLYDVTFNAEARYVPVHSNDLKPFFGIGFAAHVINAEGKLIDGTFAERSLDNIAAGVFLTTGVSVKLVRHIGVEAMARGDLLSGFRSMQLRAGGIYYFGHIRGTEPNAGRGNGTP